MIEQATRLSSLQARETSAGYNNCEDPNRFASEVRIEILMRFSGLAVLLAGVLIWPVGAVGAIGVTLWSKAILSVAFGTVGLFLFLWVNCGLRCEIRADLRRRELRICKLDAYGQTLVREVLQMRDIESLYVHIRGHPAEVTTLHRVLCVDIVTALEPAGPVENRVDRRHPTRISVFGRRAMAG